MLLKVGDWRVDGATRRLESGETRVLLEPKVMDLLLLLAQRSGQVVTREELLATLWPGVVVGEDTLARAVSKLRRALADNSKEPTYIETISKSGYRMIADVSVIEASADTAAPATGSPVRIVAAVGVGMVAIALIFFLVTGNDNGRPVDPEAERMLSRADDFYMQFSQPDNEAAIDLYERIIAMDPDNARAQAGLANALVQRAVRWPEGETGATSLGKAVESGILDTPRARSLLARAKSLAERAVRIAPDNAEAQKALGFVYSASGDFEQASLHYQRAAELDDEAWEPLLNLGEISSIEGDPQAAIDYYTRAYLVMEKIYDTEPQRIGPWHPSLGVTIAQAYEEAGENEEAEIWYRRILRLSPYEPEATAGLALILAASGELKEALELCRNLRAIGSEHESCDELLAQSATAP